VDRPHGWWAARWTGGASEGWVAVAVIRRSRPQVPSCPALTGGSYVPGRNRDQPRPTCAFLDLSFAKTPSGGQVVDRSALIMPRSGRSGRRSPCLHGVDTGDNSTVFGRNRFPSCSPARWWSGRDRGTSRDSLKSDHFRRFVPLGGAGTPDGYRPSDRPLRSVSRCSPWNVPDLDAIHRQRQRGSNLQREAPVRL
jgi:hypothetical protein